MDHFIFGDSQAGGMGLRLQESLVKLGGQKVDRVVKSGFSTTKLLQYAKDNNLGKKAEGRTVWLFFGGNDGNVTPGRVAKVRQLVEYFTGRGAQFVYAVGLPPATLITDLKRAQKVWGPQVKSADYFASHTMPSREERNLAYELILTDVPNAAYVDVRLLPLSNAVVQPSGVVFPSQPDGIHVADPTAKEVGELLAWGKLSGRRETGGGGGLGGLALLALGLFLWGGG